MSHYMVMAIIKAGSKDTVEELLAPYDENMEVPEYVAKTREELMEDMRERCRHAAECAKAVESVSHLPEDEREAAYNKLFDGWPWFHYTFTASECFRTYAAADGSSDDEVWKLVEADNEDCLDAEGNRISTYNPDSKWDWYELGGRYSGQLKIKGKGRHSDCDAARAKDIDWDSMMSLSAAQERKARHFWRCYVERKVPKAVGERGEDAVREYLAEEFGFVLYRPEWYKDRYGNADGYVRHLSLWAPYAVVDADGWHSVGEMGWFGVSNEEEGAEKSWEENFRRDFVDALAPEDYVAIIDCHI